MGGLIAVYWREMVILKRRFLRLAASYSISPLLFLIAFGWGMGKSLNVQGVDYLSFMIPGLLALSSMSQSFNIATDINVARFYWMTFEEFQTAPISYLSITLGEVLAAMTRGMLAGVIIALMALLAGSSLDLNLLLVLSLVMNTFVFGSAAVFAAMMVKSHADQASLTSFIIVPMSFLCGTFFPLERLPDWASFIIKILPLTHASLCLRAAALNQPFPWWSFLIMTVWGLLLFWAGIWAVKKASI
jgi:Nod factor-specific ABC transporter NodJ protein